MATEVAEKACSRCGVVKPISDFYRRGTKYRADCKKCVLDRQSEYYKKNKEKRISYAKEWRHANPDKCREYHRAWFTANEDSERKRLNSLTSTPEQRALSYRKYAKNNPIKIREKSHKRRARKRNNGEFLILPKEYKKLYASPCTICKSTDKIQIDHIIPIVKGGRHAIGNLQPLCASCNNKKRAKLMIEFKRDFL